MAENNNVNHIDALNYSNDLSLLFNKIIIIIEKLMQNKKRKKRPQRNRLKYCNYIFFSDSNCF